MAGGICQAKEMWSIKAVRREVCLMCVAGAVSKRMWAGGRAREVTGQISESSKGLGEDFYFILKPMRAFSKQGRDGVEDAYGAGRETRENVCKNIG